MTFVSLRAQKLIVESSSRDRRCLAPFADLEAIDLDLMSPPVVQVLFHSFAGGDAVDVTDDALPSGASTDGNQFRYSTEDGVWRHNLRTRDHTSAGTYTITMVSGDALEYTIDPTCEANFERQ